MRRPHGGFTARIHAHARAHLVIQRIPRVCLEPLHIFVQKRAIALFNGGKDAHIPIAQEKAHILRIPGVKLRDKFQHRQALRAALYVIAGKDQRIGIAILHLIQERVQLTDVPVHIADGDQPLAPGQAQGIDHSPSGA